MAAISEFFDGMHGVVFPFGGTAAPAGFLMCDGSAVSRTLYAALFAVIGTAFGAGDGSTTFNVPELRGEFIRGLDTGRGVDGGRSRGNFQPATAIYARPGKGASDEIIVTGVNSDYIAPTQTADVWPSTSTTGPSQPSPSITVHPRNVAMNYIIKT